jgi:hypothetical protein
MLIKYEWKIPRFGIRFPSVGGDKVRKPFTVVIDSIVEKT